MGNSFSRFSHSIHREVGDPTMPPRVGDLDSVPSLHSIYAYLTGLLLVLIQIKYQGLNTTPFKDHPAIVILFLTAVTAYVMALIVLTSNSYLAMAGCILCHVCGSVACELLLLVLVSPIWCFLINVTSLVLLLTLLSCYIYLLQRAYPVGTPTSSDTQNVEGQQQEATEMTDQEAPVTLNQFLENDN